MGTLKRLLLFVMVLISIGAGALLVQPDAFVALASDIMQSSAFATFIACKRRFCLDGSVRLEPA